MMNGSTFILCRRLVILLLLLNLCIFIFYAMQAQAELRVKDDHGYTSLIPKDIPYVSIDQEIKIPLCKKIFGHLKTLEPFPLSLCKLPLPDNPDFSRPDWVELNVHENMHIVKELFFWQMWGELKTHIVNTDRQRMKPFLNKIRKQWDIMPDKYIQYPPIFVDTQLYEEAWAYFSSDLKEILKSDKIRLGRSKFDLNANGSQETVHRLSRFEFYNDMQEERFRLRIEPCEYATDCSEPRNQFFIFVRAADEPYFYSYDGATAGGRIFAIPDDDVFFYKNQAYTVTIQSSASINGGYGGRIEIGRTEPEFKTKNRGYYKQGSCMLRLRKKRHEEDYNDKL